MVDEKDMKHVTFVPEERLEGYPKEEGMLIYSKDFNEIAEELRYIGLCIHEGLSNINIKMATFEETLKSLQDQINDMQSGGSEYKISLSAEPQSIPGDGKSKSKITATVTDSNGRPIAGAEVNFVTNAGVIRPTKVKTTADGTAVTELRSITAYPPSDLIVKPERLKVVSPNLLTFAERGNFVPRVERVNIGKVKTTLLPPVIGQTSTRATVTATCDQAVASVVVAFETEKKPPIVRPIPGRLATILKKTPTSVKRKSSATSLRGRTIRSTKRR